MRLTPEILESAYTFLATTPPFKSWRLPEADSVEFRVSDDEKNDGEFGFSISGGPHHIAVSQARVSLTSSLLATVAHEMVHFRLALLPGKRLDHGQEFRRLWAQVARHHGFDPKAL